MEVLHVEIEKYVYKIMLILVLILYQLNGKSDDEVKTKVLESTSLLDNMTFPVATKYAIDQVEN